MLNNVLRSDQYDHVMVSSVTVFLFIGPNLAEVHMDYANPYLYFFEQAASYIAQDPYNANWQRRNWEALTSSVHPCLRTTCSI